MAERNKIHIEVEVDPGNSGKAIATLNQQIGTLGDATAKLARDFANAQTQFRQGASGLGYSGMQEQIRQAEATARQARDLAQAARELQRIERQAASRAARAGAAGQAQQHAIRAAGAGETRESAIVLQREAQEQARLLRQLQQDRNAETQAVQKAAAGKRRAEEQYQREFSRLVKEEEEALRRREQAHKKAADAVKRAAREKAEAARQYQREFDKLVRDEDAALRRRDQAARRADRVTVEAFRNEAKTYREGQKEKEQAARNASRITIDSFRNEARQHAQKQKALRDADRATIENFRNEAREHAAAVRAKRKSYSDEAAAARQFRGQMTGLLTGIAVHRIADEFLESAKSFDQWTKTVAAAVPAGENAARMFDRLSKVALAPGLQLEGVVDVFARMRPAIKDTELTIKFIKEMGNVMATMGKGGDVMARVGVQFAQMAARGKIAQEDLRLILAEAPQVGESMMKLWGTMDPEKLTKMGVGMREFFELLLDDLAKLKRAAPSVRDAFENMRTEVTKTTGAIGADVVKNMAPLFETLTNGLRDVQDIWKQMPEGMKQASSWVMGLGLAGIMTLIAAIMNPALAAAVITLGAATATIVKSASGWKRDLEMTGEDLQSLRKAISDIAAGKPVGQTLKDLGMDLGAGPRRKLEYASKEEMEEMERRRRLPVAAGHSPEVWKEKINLRQQREEEERKAKAKEAARLAEQQRLDRLRHQERYSQRLREEMIGAEADRRAGTREMLTTSAQRLQFDIHTERLKFQEEREKALTWTDEKGRKQRLQPRAEDEFRSVQIFNQKVAALREKWMTEEREKWIKDQEEKGKIIEAGWKNEAEGRRKAYSEMLETQNQMLSDAQELSIRDQLEGVDRWRDAQLEALDAVEQKTLAQKLAVAEKRLEIEQYTVERQLELNKQLLDLDKERELAAIRLKAIQSGDLELQSRAYRDLVAATEDIYRLRRENLEKGAAGQIEQNRLKSISDRNQMVRAEIQKTFDYFQRLAEGVFDALLDKSKSVWQSMADFFRMTMLTALKAVFSNAIASMFTRMMTGMSPAGGTGQRGPGGNPLASVFGGLLGGGGGMPGQSWPVGTTPPFFPGGGSPWGGAGGARGGGLMSMLGSGPLGLLKSLGNLGMGSKALTGNFGVDQAWAGALQKGGMGAKGVGGIGGGALLAGGGILAYKGLQRGGLSGLGMTTAGGAMIGMKFGGPLGAAIGAGVGAVAGTIRLFIKGAAEKAKKRIREIYGVDIQSKQILAQIVDVAKSQYGGDMEVALYSPQIREMIQLYAMTQGQANVQGMGRPMLPVSWAASGGTQSIEPVYSGGHTITSPYIGPTTAQSIPQNVFTQLNPGAAQNLLEGKVVQIVGNNPEAVAEASTAGMEPTHRRASQQGTLMEPMTLMA